MLMKFSCSFGLAAAFLVLLGSTLFSLSHGFAVSSPRTRPPATRSSWYMSTSQAQQDSALTDRGLLKRDRYVATNRFAVRKDREPKFEQRWATRKSRLATLPGFRYFHLMRRVTLKEAGECTYDPGNADDMAGNYVSFTIWNKKSDFSAWRTGDAFKEAHGGTSITAFVSTMVSSLYVLKGAPRPAFYDGLLVRSTLPQKLPETVDGWRSVEADGVVTLPAECFVACNQFYISGNNAAAFEQRWAQRESKLSQCDGFVAFSLLRRDGTAKGHGTSPLTSAEPTYVSITIWENRNAFDKWKTSSAFLEAHDGAKETPAERPPAPLWDRPPTPVFYQGTLVITSQDGP